MISVLFRRKLVFATIIVSLFVFGGMHFFLRATEPLVQIDYILVEKSNRVMSVFFKKQQLKTYKIALGFSPRGPKEKTGDGKTPEGPYFITHKNSHSAYHRSLKISYPNVQDMENARKKGISTGGEIMIHGLKNGLGWIGWFHHYWDWTRGCIAVTNEEIEELFKATPLGTKIEIRP